MNRLDPLVREVGDAYLAAVDAQWPSLHRSALQRRTEVLAFMDMAIDDARNSRRRAAE
ncbi:hypothetical protein [Streptantibioticus ferralitis]|uniref:Uncharacterized protein n=1 Tax=Streptantibioticus ferralitis TaxID=236510 RepID=A0ABT5YRR8_9ACTN|nr:hypothetical protein [Streptantibioticus ferralitis]MDF2254249.1 hypothetical protein [Streptantibioticus ferralitis]